MLTPVKNEKQYDEAVARIYELMQMDLSEGSEPANELEILSLMIKEYDSVHYPVPNPNPIEAIKFRMEQMGMTEAQLAGILGYRSRKSEILSGKRKLSLSMIRKLHEQLSISADVLIQDY